MVLLQWRFLKHELQGDGGRSAVLLSDVQVTTATRIRRGSTPATMPTHIHQGFIQRPLHICRIPRSDLHLSGDSVLTMTRHGTRRWQAQQVNAGCQCRCQETAPIAMRTAEWSDLRSCGNSLNKFVKRDRREFFLLDAFEHNGAQNGTLRSQRASLSVPTPTSAAHHAPNPQRQARRCNALASLDQRVTMLRPVRRPLPLEAQSLAQPVEFERAAAEPSCSCGPTGYHPCGVQEATIADGRAS